MVDETTRTDREVEVELELGPERSTHHHALDPTSLAFGAIFTILGAVFFFGDIDAANLGMAWLWASLFGAIGLLLLAVGVRRYRK